MTGRVFITLHEKWRSGGSQSRLDKRLVWQVHLIANDAMEPAQDSLVIF